MSGKILRRCTICKKFHASYLVEDPESGRHYLCYSCWKARSLAAGEQQIRPPEEKIQVEPGHSRKMKSSPVQQTARKRLESQ